MNSSEESTREKRISVVHKNGIHGGENLNGRETPNLEEGPEVVEQVPLFLLGCEVKAMYPLGPIFHGSGLNMTVMSLLGNLDVGIVSCPELLPDLWDMADDFEVALKELLMCKV